MNFVFYVLLFIFLAIMWIVALPSVFKPIGKLIYKIWMRAINSLESDLEENENEREENENE